jgi:hypothetical protein
MDSWTPPRYRLVEHPEFLELAAAAAQIALQTTSFTDSDSCLSLRGGDSRRCCARAGPLQVERQQPLKDLLIREIVGPAVGIEHGRVEFAVRHVEPRRPLVVEVGE